jgi:hypothetical protein
MFMDFVTGRIKYDDILMYSFFGWGQISYADHAAKWCRSNKWEPVSAQSSYADFDAGPISGTSYQYRYSHANFDADPGNGACNKSSCVDIVANLDGGASNQSSYAVFAYLNSTVGTPPEILTLLHYPTNDASDQSSYANFKADPTSGTSNQSFYANLDADPDSGASDQSSESRAQ